MAAQLWLLRHGEAESEASDDAARELTERGERQSRAAGRALAALGMDFGAVYTSPKVRALRTAHLACEPLGLEPVVHKALREGFELADARELLLAHPEQRVLVVGHDPDLTRVVSDMTGARVHFRKGGVAGVCERELIALLRPRELERIG